MTTTADKLTHLVTLATSGPQLTGTEREEYDRICTRLQRAESDRRRAEKRSDATKLAAADRAITRARQFHKAFVEPRVSHLWAPARIIGKFQARWTGPSESGSHCHECEMVLERKDLSGPQYRTVRVLKDEGEPPTNPRSAPTSMGLAWFAVEEQIKSGQIVVLNNAEPS